MSRKKLSLIWIAFSITAFLVIATLTITYFRNETPLAQGEVEFNVKYNEEQSLDVYFPTSENNNELKPVLIYVHGGAWITGSKITVNGNRFNTAMNTLREEGYFVISPDYTLAEKGESPFPTCIEDVFEAVYWVSENAEVYGFDVDRIGLLGESAGAHLAMMIAYSEPMDFEMDIQLPEIQYIINAYGPTDLNSLYYSSTSDSIQAFIDRLHPRLSECLNISQILLGFDVNSDPEKANKILASLSPVSYLDEDEIPSFVIHGDKDQIVPIEQSFLLEKKLDSLDLEYKTLYLPGVNHAFIGSSDQQKEKLQKEIVEFVVTYNH